MTEPKFTPGPWNADGLYVCDENDVEVALCDRDNWEPNSYLIAAAPELYEALEELYAEQNGPPLEKYKTSWEKAIRKTEAALAKARGEA